MGKKEDYLKAICLKHFKSGKYKKPSKEQLLSSIYNTQITEVYNSLGGILPSPPTGYNCFDIQLKDFIIELDEENHFNQYRQKTLESTFYSQHSYFDINKYISYSKKYKDKCCKHGNYGTTKPSSNQFKGDLPRWKQRAFYDFLRDITSIMLNVPIIRISIYDTYKKKRIDNLIKNKEEDLLIEYINLIIRK